ncbi:T9SS type A sorting domain-containing protein, partial [Longibacter sp.]|uniref:T9SS type A sorting domain-containing protein n=1 Tax=Longibacter sp. TaxID=2045415 RepID=UPI003EBE208F
PVELGPFTASLDGDDVILNWTTFSETANAGFDVQQRSGDAPFRTVGQVEGQGTTQELTRYTFRVADLAPGTYQFRLRQVDIDGSESFGPTITATINLAGRYTISSMAPNPVSARGSATLQVADAQTVTAELYDLLGRRVQTVFDGPLTSQSPTELTVDAATLPSGVYFLRVRGDQFQATQRFVVVR